MQRPPQFPSILASRQSYQWINRINQKFTAFAALDLSAAQRERLHRRLEVEFVSATLALEGLNISPDDVVRVARLESEAAGQAVKERGEGAAILNLLNALRLVKAYADSEGRNAALTLERLLELRAPACGGMLRQGESQASSVRAEHLSVVLENACRWFTMASIAELNPVEQAALALLRLLEIAPFDEANERTALVAASLFTLRNELPPVIIKPERAPEYRDALDEGRRMNTQPMVELVAGAIEESLDEILKFAAAGR